MDWLTLTPAEVENDALAPVCVHCGAPAAARHNQDFEWHPEWVGWLYLAGVLPGMVAHAICNKKMRVALPVCARHGPMTTWQVVVAAAGWLVLPGVFAGPVLGGLFACRAWDIPLPPLTTDTGILVSSLLAAGFGLLFWLAWLIHVRRGYRSLTVRSIDADGIALVDLAEPFVKAMKEQRQSIAATKPAFSPSSLDLEKITEL